MEAMVSLVVWLLIGTQISPAKWILRGQDKESPSKNKVLLLSLGLLGLEAAMLVLICHVVSAWDDPAEMIDGAGLLYLGAGGLVGLLAMIIVRICKDRAAVAALPQLERRSYWIDVLLRVGLMLIPSLVGAWAILGAWDDIANHPVFNGIVICSVLAEVVLLILRYVSKPVYEQWTPEQREEAKKAWKLREEGKIGRKHGIWAENPYEPLPEKNPAEQPDEAAEDRQA